MQGFDTVDVQQGTLGLSGNNDGFTGKITVRKDASLSAKAESLPVNHPVNGNVGNIDLTNGGTLHNLACAKAILFLCRYVTPILIVIILLNGLKVF